MTTIDTRADSNLERAQRCREEREWLAHCGPVPTAADIARPFLQGIYALHEISQRFNSHRILAEQANEREEGAALIAAVRHALDLIDWATDFCGGDRNLSIRQNARIIGDSFDAEGLRALEQALEQSEVDAILAGGVS